MPDQDPPVGEQLLAPIIARELGQSARRPTGGRLGGTRGTRRRLTEPPGQDQVRHFGRQCSRTALGEIAEHDHGGLEIGKPGELGPEPGPRAAVRHRARAAILVHHEAQRVGDRLAVIEHAGGLELPERRGAAHLPGIEVPVPQKQVLDGGVDRAVAGLLPVREGKAEPAGRAPRVRARLSGHDQVVAVHIPGVGHAQGLEDPLRRELAEGLAARSFHDDREEEEAGVAVEELRAGLEVRRLLPGEDVECVPVIGHRLFPDAAPLQEIDVVAEPAGVMQQVADRDRPEIARDFGEILLDLVVERQLPVLCQEHDGHRGELLGDRADVEHRPGRDRHAELDAGEPVSSGVGEPPVLHDAQGAARRSGGGERGEDRVHPHGERGGQAGSLAPQAREGVKQEGNQQRVTEPWEHAGRASNAGVVRRANRPV